jgi:hypothetical protein
MFCSETSKATAFDFYEVSLSSGLRIFWDANLLLHFIVLHQIFLNHYMGVLVLLSDDVCILPSFGAHFFYHGNRCYLQ